MFELPAVKRAKKVNTLSRVHRRLIEPIETDQDNEARLSFQHTVFARPVCRTGRCANPLSRSSSIDHLDQNQGVTMERHR